MTISAVESVELYLRRKKIAAIRKVGPKPEHMRRLSRSLMFQKLLDSGFRDCVANAILYVFPPFPKGGGGGILILR